MDLFGDQVITLSTRAYVGVLALAALVGAGLCATIGRWRTSRRVAEIGRMVAAALLLVGFGIRFAGIPYGSYLVISAGLLCFVMDLPEWRTVWQRVRASAKAGAPNGLGDRGVGE